MQYVFFSTGPLHLIHIFEFLNQNKINNYEIYVFKSVSSNVNLEMTNTEKFLKMKNIVHLSWGSIKIIRFFKFVYFLKKLKSKFHNQKITFIISDFKYLFYHVLRIFFDKSEFILIDEGTGTLIAYNKYISKKLYFPIYQYNGFFFKIFKFIFKKEFRKLIYSNFKIYTIFDNQINLKNKIDNKFKYIKKRINVNFTKDNSIVFFIGTKLSERGFITLDEELKILNKIKIYWHKRQKKIIYVAKRTSSQQKLDLIKEKLSIDFVKFQLPLEIAIASEYKKFPFAICSHGSTLDITLNLIYGIRSFVIIPRNLKQMSKLDYSDKYISFSDSEIIYL